MDHQNFKLYYNIFHAQFTICLHEKSFLDTPQEIDKILLIQQEAGQI
jgi:hypothetical protein